MALTPLSINTDLKTFKANVRANTKTISVQQSQLLEPFLDDIVHNAVTSVRTEFSQQLANKYLMEAKSTDSDITETSNLIDISTLEVFDVNSMDLRDATHGPIRFKSSTEFDNLRTIYSTTHLADALFARVVNVKATNNKIQIETYRGSNVTTAGNLTLTYERNAKKATADATKIDLPDEFMPLAIERATILVFDWIAGKVSPITRVQSKNA
jgi:hypothetical protein